MALLPQTRGTVAGERANDHPFNIRRFQSWGSPGRTHSGGYGRAGIQSGTGRLIPFLEQLPPSAAGGKFRTKPLQQGCPSHWPSHPAGPLLLVGGGNPGCGQLCVLQTTAKLIYIKNKEHTIPKWLGFVY